MPVSESTFNTQMDRLLETFRPGDPKDRYVQLIDEYARRFQGSERIGDLAFSEAVTEAIDHCQRLPTVQEMVQIVEAVLPDVEREERKALPPPPEEPLDALAAKAGISRTFWDRNVAIGKARARNRKVRILAWQQEHPNTPLPAFSRDELEPSEEQIQAVLAEMGAAKATVTPTDEYARRREDAKVQAKAVAARRPEWPGAVV